ncbi:MAG: hypothetical protein DWQ07_12930 [Chloroflexi bacterium]|nr:MAG: hypothetical protein DWQ07_12930 [Chloroflexota bacterium]MBL1196944.1 hypothetical protein [Chloroflexota bacterium]NOH14240.1 hypothetical protein [Chloroflexota bacterium]
MTEILSSYSEAISTIVVFILGGLLTALVGWIRSRRGNWVTVTKVSETPLLTVSEQIKNELEIKFRGEQVESLVITTLELENISNVHIEKFQIHLLPEPKGDLKASEKI